MRDGGKQGGCERKERNSRREKTLQIMNLGMGGGLRHETKGDVKESQSE